MSLATWFRSTVLGNGWQLEPLMLTNCVRPNRIVMKPGGAACDVAGRTAPTSTAMAARATATRFIG